jgi:hypothetical protein
LSHSFNYTDKTRQVIRREVKPSAVTVGQIAQIKIKFRLLKQENGSFTFREVLKGVYILHDGASTVSVDDLQIVEGVVVMAFYRRLHGSGLRPVSGSSAMGGVKRSSMWWPGTRH